MIANNALNLIGNTPLIRLKKICDKDGYLYAKCEFMQPGGSVKDRAALQIIKDAYSNKKLKSDQPVVEMTSGNMGAGLAVVCNVYNNPFTAVMSVGNSPARKKMLEALGAKVELVEQVDGKPGQVTGKDIYKATIRAMELAKETNAFYVDQFNNISSINAHINGTGPEIYNDIGLKINAFVAAIGSGGTFVGTSKYLKKVCPNIKCVAVEPKGAEILSGKEITKPKHIIQGIGYGLIPPHWDVSIVDDIISVSDEEAEHYKKLLAYQEGLHVGYSAAANVCASLKLIKSGKIGSNPVVVTILCDTALKY